MCSIQFKSHCVNIFGCSPEDVRDDFSPVVRVTLPEDIDKLIKSIELSAQKCHWQCEYRVQIPGQPVKWLFGQSTPEKLADGSILWHGFNTDITERKKSQEELQQTLDRLSKAMNTTIHLLAGAVEARDPYTAGHQTRSADLARAIATEMGIPKAKIDGIGMACSIHDIGKLSVPAEILTKSSKLTKVEFAMVKEHAVKGYDMLKDVESSAGQNGLSAPRADGRIGLSEKSERGRDYHGSPHPCRCRCCGSHVVPSSLPSGTGC